MKLRIYLLATLCFFQATKSMEERKPESPKEQEITCFPKKDLGATHYDFDKHLKAWASQLQKSWLLAQTNQEKVICEQQIKALAQVKSDLKDATPQQKFIADHIIGEILNAMPEYDTEASKIFCTIIKGVAKGCVSQIWEWTDPRGPIIQMGSSITDLAGCIYEITTSNQDVPESIKEDPLAHMLYNEYEHFVKGKDNRTLLSELWKTATNLIEHTSPEQKGEILGRIIGDALVFKFISKIPRITKYGINNLLKDSGLLLEAISDGTFSGTKSVNLIEETIRKAISSKIGFKGITEIPKNLLLSEYIKLAKEYKRPLNAGSFEEAFIANAGLEEGFFEELLVRPQELSSPVDFVTIDGKKRIDIKSPRSTYINPKGKIYKNFDIKKLIGDLQDDLSKGEITLFNTTKLDKADLKTLMQRVEAATPESQRHLVHYCFNEQNILDLAEEGVKLPRMVKDHRASPVKFGFYQLNADQITPFQMLQEILKVTPEPELAAIIKNFNETVQTLYPNAIQEVKSSSVSSPNQSPSQHGSSDHSEGEKEAPYPTDQDNIQPNNPPPYRPSNLLLACLTDMEYDGLTFKKMIDRAKQERFKQMIKYLSNRSYGYIPKTHKEQMDLQIQNTQIAYNQVAEQVKEIEARQANFVRFTVGTSPDLVISENQVRRNINDMQKRNLWNAAYQAFPEIKKLLDDQIKDVASTAMKSLTSDISGSSLVARIKLLNLQIAGWIGDSFENFKLDIAQCYFDKYGKFKEEPDLKTASEITAKFFRSISFNETEYKSYIEQANNLNLTSLGIFMENELKGLQSKENIQVYYTRQLTELFNTGLIQQWLSFGYNGIIDRVFNHEFNTDFLSVLNFCSMGQFHPAYALIQSQKNEHEQNFLRNIYNLFYSKAYNQNGILKIYQNDPFLYEKGLAKTLAQAKRDIIVQEKLNNILALRHLMKEKIAATYNISPIDRPIEADIILYLLVTFKLSRGNDPLVAFAEDPTYSKIINYFFNKNGEVKTLDGFLKDNDGAFSETIISKFFSSNSGFARQFLDTKLILNKKEIDKTIVVKLLEYLQESAKCSDDFIKESYKQIYSNIITLLRKNRASAVKFFGNIMLIGNYTDKQQLENHKTILYLVIKCTKLLIECDEFEDKKYNLLESLPQKINQLFELNKNLTNSLKVETDLSDILKIFKIDKSIITKAQSKSNT